MTFWLGRPGALAALPHPMKGIDPTSVRGGSVAQTIGGGQVVNYTAGAGRRTYQMQWSGIAPEQYSLLEEFHAGLRGPGPYALIDPGRRNKLSADQSGTGSTTGTVAGWTVSGAGESLATVTTPVFRGPNALRWTLPAAPATGLLRATAPTGLPGTPWPTGQPCTFSAQLQGGSTDPIVTVAAQLVWVDAVGATISTTTGSTITTAAGSWSTVSVTLGAPPAGAVAVLAGLTVTPASVTAQAFVYIDAPLLDMSSTVRTFVAGTGVALVSFRALSQLYKTIPFNTCQATLIEVG